MIRYVIGVDFGSLSGRAILVDSRNGSVAAQRTMAYPHGVMTNAGPGWALHDPMDYLAVLKGTVPFLLKDAGILPDQVAAIGWDVTSCTMLPALADGTPLSALPEYIGQPHACAKLWKHLAAERQARHIEQALRAYDPALLENYGDSVASQWMLPKILQLVEDAPEIYDRAQLLMEVSDWLVLVLTGTLSRSTCHAGFKNFYDPATGYLPKDLLVSLHPKLTDLVEEKLRGRLLSPWESAGGLRVEWAEQLGLYPGTLVAAGVIDAHAGLPGSGVAEAGRLLMAIGTSTCHMLLASEKRTISGICGVVKDSVLPGLYAYEAGQACVGDLLDWFVTQSVPAGITEAAHAQGMDIHAFLSAKAAQLPPGSGGLMALGWWNGQRSPFVDDRLSGMMLGMTIRTTPDQQYRALMESTAYGTRLILDRFVSGGIPIQEVVACGGITQKNPLMLQIYADVLNHPIRVTQEAETTALGAAILAAAAAKLYPAPADAVRAMACPVETLYRPDPKRAALYDELYREYAALAAYFARENLVMHRLRRI